MHKIEKTQYGFKITASGPMDVDEIELVKLDLLRTLSSHNGPFSLYVDLREFQPLDSSVMEVIQDMQRACKLMSLKRTALIISSHILKKEMQFAAIKTGTTEVDRFFDASEDENYTETALAWVIDGVEPMSSRNLKKIS